MYYLSLFCSCSESFRLAVIDKLVWDSSPILLSSPPPTTATTLNLVSSVGATIVDTSQQFHLVSSLLGKHFVGLLTAFCPGFENPNWYPGSPAKAGFEELVKGCNLHAWKQHDHVIAIVSAQVQPKKAPAEGTPEQISQSYVSLTSLVAAMCVVFFYPISFCPFIISTCHHVQYCR